jgi:acyl-CoA synthetase (AMP-forming)/AMP-acid ligase II/NADP-dependent 3-hydroxy acid dehydrogenase YdfG
MPLTAEGRPNDDALFALPIISPEVIRRCEELVNSKVFPARSRVVMEDNVLHSRPLHLSDLIPAWRSQPIEDGDEASVSLEGIPLAIPGAMAFSDGGALRMPDGAASTVTEAFIRTATKHPRKGVTCVTSRGTETFETYATILGRARRVLSGLRKQGLRPGDSEILQIDTLRDHFAAFWGCILGGIHPVVVAVAPSYDPSNSVVMKLYNTWVLLRQPPIIASASILGSIGALDLKALAVEDLEQESEANDIYQASPDDVVFYQLTSGSTGSPKCIQETHRGILQHVYGSAQFNGYAEDDVVLNWLPLDHVVPTLTVHLKDACLGCDEVQVRTDAIAADPLLWLELIERHRVSHTWAPNFGFKIVAESLSANGAGHFDLSSVKRFMNAGEQVTLRVVEEFLNCVGPFGVPQQAMQPSFGMAEACTCMTYRNDFTVDSATHWILKSSLGGLLRKGDARHRSAVSFVDLGRPIPGVQIRITDHENNLVPEGVIGRFQIKGAVITPGYLHNENANRDAFVGDGWFNSGDLGFIVDGRLTLTGREKEMIIIRGANFYCYEIEDVVNRVEDVEPTFSAACAVDDGSGSEGLAVFFVARAQAAVSQAAIVRAIRSRVASDLGVTPAYIVPLSKAEFPKTTSGKIQRGQLKQSLAEGRYDVRLAELDIELANANTLPDWFFRTVWRRKEAAGLDIAPEGKTVLLFDDGSSIADELCRKLGGRGQSVIRVLSGASFQKIGPYAYVIDPAQAADYRRLFESMFADSVAPFAVAHLWTCSAAPGEDCDIREDVLDHGVYSLVHLVQALAAPGRSDAPKRIVVVSRNAQALGNADVIVGEKAMAAGLVRTIGQEFPSLVCSHVDLQEDSPMSARLILNEIDGGVRDAEVAYRDGIRWIPRLERVFPVTRALEKLPFNAGDIYLVSGGVGGIGVEIASYLVREFGVRVLAIGRRARQDVSLPDFLKNQPDLFRYESVDVTSAECLAAVVDRVKQEWGSPLAGIFHLAAAYHECSLVDETRESLASVFRPKVHGAAALHSLLKDNGGIFVSFSSVTHLFGGATIGAYSAANRFLDAFAHRQRANTKVRSYCLDWSTWEDVGLSKDYPALETLRARGYEAISVRRGIQSLLAGICRAPGNLIVGLDDRRAFLRQHSEGQPLQFRRVVALAESGGSGSIEAIDAFGTRITCDIRAVGSLEAQLTAPSVSLSTLERRIAALWREVLQLDSVGVHDNFFELGGNSLLLAKMAARIQLEFGKTTSVVEMFRHPTVAKLAQYLGSSEEGGEESRMESARERAMTRKSKMRKRREPELAELKAFGATNTYGSSD